jgi:hypothetical protein
MPTNDITDVLTQAIDVHKDCLAPLLIEDIQAIRIIRRIG